ncbi:MAG: ClpX C4-type zinc finger protein [Blastocatellia bacterium]
MKSGGGPAAGKGAATDRCSFCGKPARKVAAVFSRDDHRICSECLDICMEIMTDSFFSGETRATPDDK